MLNGKDAAGMAGWGIFSPLLRALSLSLPISVSTCMCFSRSVFLFVSVSLSFFFCLFFTVRFYFQSFHLYGFLRPLSSSLAV